jgi:hypothetical protein
MKQKQKQKPKPLCGIDRLEPVRSTLLACKHAGVSVHRRLGHTVQGSSKETRRAMR